jgi:phytoene dehydrogenase-like protein
MPQAVVIGSGPNGLAAAIELTRAGWDVEVYEAKSTVGGGMRTLEITEPGFYHDICSAIHPMGLSSKFFRSVPLDQYGVEWIQPELPLAHPFDDGTSAILARNFAETSESLGVDGKNWRSLMKPFADNWDKILHEFLGPINHIPSYPLILAYFGLHAIQPARILANWRFSEERARALFAGIAAHVIMPLDHSPTAAFGLTLGAAGHAVGWPLPKGGSQTVANALAAYLNDLGGKIQTDHPVSNIDEFPEADAIIFNLTPRQILSMARHHLPPGYRRGLENYRYGPGVFKVDWALSEPVPWTSPDVRRAGAVHIGGTFDEIAVSEHATFIGRTIDKPYVLVAQQSLFDPTRAPDDKHTLWAYCHVPHNSPIDMTDAIESQIERFAPGFRDTIIARHTMTAQETQLYNPNYVGGDINGGIQDLRQLFTRPVTRWNPYTTPNPRLFIASTSTPPGGGVHGMAGYHAARAILARHPI